MSAPDLQQLLEKQVNNELTKAEFQQLQNLLRGSKKAQREYAQALIMETMLEAELAPIRRVMRISQFLDEQQKVTDPVPVPMPPQKRSPKLFIIVAAAAVLLTIFSIQTWQSNQDPIIARVQTAAPGSIIEKDGRQIPLKPGMEIRANNRVLVSGRDGAEVAFSYDDGTTVRLKSDTSALFREYRGRIEKDLKLEVGSVFLDVEPQPHGQPFTIHTRGAIAKVIGTKLTIDTNDQQTRLEVLEGIVDFGGLKTRSLERVRKGSIAIVNHGNGSVELPTRRMIAMNRWQAWQQTINSDPALIAYYDFQEKDESLGILTNKGQRVGVSQPARLLGCHWDNGRFFGKRALRFNGSAQVDCGRDPAFENLSALTIMCWIRAEGAAIQYQTIASQSDHSWRLQRWDMENGLEFSLDNTRLHGTTPVLEPGNGWQHIAATWDGKAMSLFVNGKLDTAIKSKLNGIKNANDKFPVTIGWNAERPDRGFIGKIDEVLLLSRSMTKSEIVAAYRAGKPL